MNRTSHRLGFALLVLEWCIAGALLAVAALRVLWHDGLWVLLTLNLFTPYIYLPAYPIALGALWRRRWPLLAVAGSLIAAHLTWSILPLVAHKPPPVAGKTIRIASANLLMVNQDPATLAAELENFDADIYFLQELSARWDAELERRGFWQRYPFHRRVVGEDPFGGAIAARIPLHDFQVFPLADLPQIRAILPFEGTQIQLINVHTVTSFFEEDISYHHRGLEKLLHMAEGLHTRPFLLAGDFNATSDSKFADRMRPIADDAWDLAGHGFGFTWPNGRYLVPPIRIDHIFLSKNLTATWIRLGRGAGSDHHPLVAEIGRRRN